MQRRCWVVALGIFVGGACQPRKEAAKPGATSAPQTAPTQEPAGTGQLSLSTNALAAAYPEGMTLGAFPRAIDETPGQAPSGTLILSTGLGEGDAADPVAVHPKEAMMASRDRLDAKEGVDCLTREMLESMRSGDEYIDACYGFDTGIVNGLVMGGLRGGQNGIVASVHEDPNQRTTSAVRAAFAAAIGEPSSGPFDVRSDTSNEVCMVAAGRHYIRKETAAVEGLLQLMQGTLCQARRDGITELPAEVEASLDLSDSLKKAPTSAGDTYVWKSARITRLADRESRKVYKTTLSYETRSGDGSVVRAHEVELVHSPGADGNSNYNGVISLKVKDGTSPWSDATSFLYSRTGDTYETARVQYEVRRALLQTESPFASDGRVDLNAGASQDGSFPPGTSAGAATYIAFDVNPFTFSGKISFWSNPNSANYLEAARGFVYDTVQTGNGMLKGCAVAGSIREGSIRRNLKEGKAPLPTGCFTPQIGSGDCASFSGHPDNSGLAVWKQCFVQNDAGIYVLDAEALPAMNEFGYRVFPSAVEAGVPDVNLLGMPTLGVVR